VNHVSDIEHQTNTSHNPLSNIVQCKFEIDQWILKLFNEDLKSINGFLKLFNDDLKSINGHLKLFNDDLKSINGNLKLCNEDLKSFNEL